MFDRVVCISLARRPDRRQAFLGRVPPDWPWRPIEVIDAVDGQLCKHPGWWKQGGGAWGCYKSHLNVIEQALNAKAESILIFEDDATFVPDFSKRAEEYIARLPDDWGQAYLGGQHLRRAELVCEGVLRAANINRTHAYAIRGRPTMLAIYRWLNATKEWRNRNHIDHHYGRLHATRAIPAYAPTVWLCGQAADSKSDVCWKPVQERWWWMKNPPAESKETLPAYVNEKQTEFVAVVGLHRSGSSCIAMMLHKLGVNMGDKLGGYEKANGGGGEAVGLARLCERAARFPKVGISDPDGCKRKLAGWIADRRRRNNGVIGGKYPHLCAMGAMLKAICGKSLRVIHCDRPLADSIDSLKRRSRRSHGWLRATDEQCEQVQQWLWDEKVPFVSSLPLDVVLDVDYGVLMSQPECVVDEMIAFLGLSPSAQQRSDAISHVKLTKEIAA
jgi:hypothetical protein